MATVVASAKKEKLYPFSGTKHAHDIDFRRARCKNELYEMGMDEEHPYSAEQEAELLKLEEQLDELIGYMHEGIVWLPGRLYSLAQESVAWAAMQRGNR